MHIPYLPDCYQDRPALVYDFREEIGAVNSWGFGVKESLPCPYNLSIE